MLQGPTLSDNVKLSSFTDKSRGEVFAFRFAIKKNCIVDCIGTTKAADGYRPKAIPIRVSHVDSMSFAALLEHADVGKECIYHVKMQLRSILIHVINPRQPETIRVSNVVTYLF